MWSVTIKYYRRPDAVESDQGGVSGISVYGEQVGWPLEQSECRPNP